MAEAANYQPFTGAPPTGTSVAVVMPLFPYLPGARESLVSLARQTRPPELVILLDDGGTPDAEALQQAVPSLRLQVLQTDTKFLRTALDPVFEYLERFQFIGFLQPGDRYAPTRIAHCLQSLGEPVEGRAPAMLVTGIAPVDSQGRALPDNHPRRLHLERLWAPGRAGAGMAEWLGTGYFAGPLSNIFARRDHLVALDLPDDTPEYDRAVVLVSALEGMLAVSPEPLLEHYPALPDRKPTPRVMAETLRTQMPVLSILGPRLDVSPETRSQLASYHRAAWNSLSGVREDLFLQAVLCLAADAGPERKAAALGTILRSREAQTVPVHWSDLFDGRDPFDVAGYAAALQRARTELDRVAEENRRLRQIAEAAQASAWVRFGAWLGEQCARRVMELEEEDASAPPAEEPKDGATGSSVEPRS